MEKRHDEEVMINDDEMEIYDMTKAHIYAMHQVVYVQNLTCLYACIEPLFCRCVVVSLRLSRLRPGSRRVAEIRVTKLNAIDPAPQPRSVFVQLAIARF